MDEAVASLSIEWDGERVEGSGHWIYLYLRIRLACLSHSASLGLRLDKKTIS